MAAKALLVAVAVVGVVAVAAVLAEATAVGGGNGWKMNSDQKDWATGARGLHGRPERAEGKMVPMVKSALKLLEEDDPCLEIDCSADKEVCSMSGCGGCINEACTAGPKEYEESI